MTGPVRRMRLGAALLGLVFVVSVAGYCCFGRSLLDAIYMVVITISSVGYGEHSDLANGEKIFTAGVIVVGITTVAFVFGSFLQLVTQGELARALGSRKMSKIIDQMSDHVVVCGFGRMGQMLAEELQHRKTPFAVIERDPERLADAQRLGFVALGGDATEEEALLAAGVLRAKCLVTSLPDDASNVFISLTAPNLNAKLQIIARGEQRSTHKKLIQAGADRVVLLAAIGAQRIATMVTHPSTVELMELVSNRAVIDIELGELTLPGESPLLGKSLMEIETRRKHGLLIVAVKQEDGSLVFNPAHDFILSARDTLIVMGRMDHIEAFRAEFKL